LASLYPLAIVTLLIGLFNAATMPLHVMRGAEADSAQELRALFPDTFVLCSSASDEAPSQKPSAPGCDCPVCHFGNLGLLAPPDVAKLPGLVLRAPLELDDGLLPSPVAPRLASDGWARAPPAFG
jgi:hypothetical protein